MEVTEPNFPTGEVGWLYAQARTCIGKNAGLMSKAFSVFDINKGETHEWNCKYGWQSGD
jgi:hypothetical protein